MSFYKKVLPAVLAMLAAGCISARAQGWSIGTNFVQWANFGTVNVEAGYALNRHFSLAFGGRLNAWDFNQKDQKYSLMNKQSTLYAGARYWPWYVFSGWWFGAKAQYSHIRQRGLYWSSMYENGHAVGAGLSAGYTLMLTKNLNLEIGVGGWAGGYVFYERYNGINPTVVDSGPRGFIKLDDIILSLTYLF